MFYDGCAPKPVVCLSRNKSRFLGSRFHKRAITEYQGYLNPPLLHLGSKVTKRLPT